MMGDAQILIGNKDLTGNRAFLNTHLLLRYLLKTGLLVFCIIFFDDVSGQERCLAHILHQKKMEEDPEYRRQRRLLERRIQDFTIDSKAREGAMVTIPVVFQVIHNGDPVGMNENLSDAQLQAQLAQLNADYGRTNTDAGNTPMGFQDEAANTMIQFCLATMDPNGQATTGIVRTHINTLNNVTENDCWNAAYIDQNIVTPLSWNTANYLNIFVVRFIEDDDCMGGQSTLGYATFPTGTPFPTDVAVHAARTIGSLSSPNPAGGAVGMGRTVTHEVGHWLNLDHIWGNGGCASDDQVADTPLQDMESSGCPTFPQTDNCTMGGDGIMFMNYMDYSDDNCMNLFTQGQATRMMAAINASRQGLLNSQCAAGGNDGYTCANAIEINAAGTYNAPGASQGNGAIAGGPGTHANWYRFTPPMTGMIRIFTCGLNGAGNNHFHLYHLNTGSCGTLNLNDVQYTQDRGCAASPNDPAAGVFLENIPVTMGVPVYIEWDDALGNTNPFTWTLEYMAAGAMCTDYVATNVPVNIVDEMTVTSTINVPTGGTISDVNIKNLTGTHTYISDLTFSLMSPQGTTVILMQNPCNDEDNFNISLDDAAANPIMCPINDGATEQPANPLAGFNGENPMGNWVLSINDNFAEDPGQLTGWTLEICTQGGGGGDCPPTRAVDDTPIASGTYQAGTQLTSMGTIPSPNNVIFRAGNNVELRPNFEIALNANLEVTIAGCP